MGDRGNEFRVRYRIAGLRVKVALLRLRLRKKAGFRHDQPRDHRGRWVRIGDKWVFVDGRWTSGTGRVVRRDRTGDKKIDQTSDHLLETAQDVIDEIGPGSGALYGASVHKIFADKVKGLNLPGIGRDGVEQSFSLGDTVRYGFDGSIRTDVILREGNSAGSAIVAVWDLKTGSATLSARRVREIRANLGVGSETPVIELQIIRGINLKGSMLIRLACQR